MGLAEVLGAHAGWEVRRGKADRRGVAVNERHCTCGELLAWDDTSVAHQAHVEAALLAHLADVLGGDETREVVAERLSVREMTTYSPDAHEDHNHWSWLGSGHGDRIRNGFRAEADAALAAVREVLGLPGGGA